MPDQIDWAATQDTREGWDATDLIDHWRNLAFQEHELRIFWQERCQSLAPLAAKHCEEAGLKWPFR